MEGFSNRTTIGSPGRTAARTRIRDRRALVTELQRALRSEGSERVLVLFAFIGLKEHLTTVTRLEGSVVLGSLGDRLSAALGGFGDLYAPRRGEFCVLFDHDLAAIRSLVSSVPAELDDEVRPLPIRTTFGIAVLPDEAIDAIGALRIADQRVRAVAGDFRPDAVFHHLPARLVTGSRRAPGALVANR
jgi:GGDEF domain-containing protein